jgi:alkanesulfonate monooxygenase SsuD/methylene tetrahydromethanopterin reductase-like flavin-dependent oxidoreductase (luciferase family)
VQQPHPPVWLGGRAPGALRRAAELGDGWIGAGRASTAEFRQQTAEVRGYLERSGRSLATFSIAKRVYLAIDRDLARARRRLQQSLATIYGNDVAAEDIALIGDVEQVTEGLDEVRAAGAELVVLNPLFDELDHLEILARDVLPALGVRRPT